MQYTSHYNLMLPEGTDIVNPLVQQNPNFSDIDNAMFANKQGVVGSATELTAGTVHTITRSNTDSNIIRFTATSNWNAGDSMVIDSTPVSVFLSDGTAPGTGAYIINTEVLAILSGTRVTLITSKTGMTAADVNTLIAAALQPVVLNSVTADGIKTWSELLEDLVTSAVFSNIKAGSYIETINGTIREYFNLTAVRSTRADFLGLNMSLSGGSYMTIFRCAPGGNFEHFVQLINSGGTISYSDLSSTVPSSGFVINLYK